MVRSEKREASKSMFGDEGAVPAFVGPANGQSSRLTSVRFRSLQILQGMFALISIPPHLGDCCIGMVELYRPYVTVPYVIRSPIPLGPTANRDFFSLRPQHPDNRFALASCKGQGQG
jgi:hypothetical protein